MNIFPFVMKILFLSAILIGCLHLPVQAQDSVSVIFQVVVPQETPENGQIFWAGSLNKWDPGDQGSGFSPKDYARPLTRHHNAWLITLTSVKGDTVTYKYTRGSMFSVEENPDYTYRQTRTVIFDRNKQVNDTVAAWHDLPPASLAEQWPKIPLQKTDDLIITYKGRLMEGSSPILYDWYSMNHIYGMDAYHQVDTIPKNLTDTLSYLVKVSNAPDNTSLVLAGKKDSIWNIYVDQNNDERISTEEWAFAIKDTTQRYSWTGQVTFDRLSDGNVVQDSTKMGVSVVWDLPPGYSSSKRDRVPDLVYNLPFKNRKGKLNSQGDSLIFYVSNSLETSFKDYFRLLVDHDGNDTLEIGSGSTEFYAIDNSAMYRQQKFYLFPTFKLGDRHWEVVDIDREGRWIRLRPALEAKKRKPIVEGQPAPSWQSTTLAGNKISSKSLRGTYVLLDFWGSWCGPCIQEMPNLKKTYERFHTKNFTIVGMAYDSKTALQKTIKKFEITWPQILDADGRLAQKFLVNGYPTYYLIGPDGTVLEKGEELRGEHQIKTLEKYLEN